MAGSHDDAILIVELSKLGAMLGVPEVARSIFAEDFDPDSVELGDPGVQIMLNYFEIIATLVKNDLLDGDLVHDWVWVGGIWERLGPAAKRARERTGFAGLYENIETLAAGSAPAAAHSS
jgi:hypothetical protein